MTESRRRRASWCFLLSLVLLLPLWSCQMPPTGGGSSGTASTTSGSEAERTRKIEEKAAEIERRAEEIRNMTGTEQEKIDAVNQLERDRQELIRMQEGSSTP